MVTQPTVLFVDDEVEFLEVLLKRMKKRGVAAVGAASGEEALGWIEREEADLVVLDVNMPGMDGIQVLREIKDLRPRLEVILLTGHASLKAASEGMALGAVDYLIKPINFDDLLLKIQDAWKSKRLRMDENESSLKAIRGRR
jgi:DNA-binding NtrC family response regulator